MLKIYGRYQTIVERHFFPTSNVKSNVILTLL